MRYDISNVNHAHSRSDELAPAMHTGSIVQQRKREKMKRIEGEEAMLHRAWAQWLYYNTCVATMKFASLICVHLREAKMNR